MWKFLENIFKRRGAVMGVPGACVPDGNPFVLESFQYANMNVGKIANDSLMVISDLRIDVHFRSLSSGDTIALPVREYFSKEDFRLYGEPMTPRALHPSDTYQFRLPRKQNVFGEKVTVVASGRIESGEPVSISKIFKLLV
jgi:hypothetical protein